MSKSRNLRYYCGARANWKMLLGRVSLIAVAAAVSSTGTADVLPVAAGHPDNPASDQEIVQVRLSSKLASFSVVLAAISLFGAVL